MTVPGDLEAIFDRITSHTHTEGDITTLKTLIVSGDGNTVQLGKYNVNINQGRDVQVGDRIYQGPDAEAIKAIILQVIEEYNSKKDTTVESKRNRHFNETVYSTLLPILEMPSYIYEVPCKYNDLQEREATAEIVRPNDENEIYPFIIRGGMLYCFQNLKNPNGPFQKLVNNQKIKRYKAEEWCEDPEHRKWFVSLLNRSLNKLTGRKGLRLDKVHQRYYFQPEEAGQTLDVTYRPLNQSSTERNVVWQPVTKKTGELKPYWYHLAVALKFHQVGTWQWCLSIRPEMRVTKDGFKLFDPKKTGSRVTHKKSKMFNYDLLKEVNFWRDFLSGGEPRIILSFGKAQTIIVSTSMIQGEIEWPGIPEEYTKPFKNVEYEENLLTLLKLYSLENQDASSEEDNWDDWDSDDFEEEEDEY